MLLFTVLDVVGLELLLYTLNDLPDFVFHEPVWVGIRAELIVFRVAIVWFIESDLFVYSCIFLFGWSSLSWTVYEFIFGRRFSVFCISYQFAFILIWRIKNQMIEANCSFMYSWYSTFWVYFLIWLLQVFIPVFGITCLMISLRSASWHLIVLSCFLLCWTRVYLSLMEFSYQVQHLLCFAQMQQIKFLDFLLDSLYEFYAALLIG